MKLWVKITLAVVAVLLVILIAVPIGLVMWANGEGGHEATERLIADKTGGQVKVSGIEGHFPDHLRIGHAELSDAEGPWLILDGVALDWKPLALLGKSADIQLLAAEHVQVLRLPVDDDKAPSSRSKSSSGSLDLPVGISLDTLKIAKLDLAEAVAGARASLSVTGTAKMPMAERLSARLAVKRLDGEGEYGVEGGYGKGGSDLEITASEPVHGLIAQVADLPDLGKLSIRATLKGPSNDETLALQIEAGDLHAQAQGKLDLDHRTLDLGASIQAPAMRPRADLSWASAKLDAHIRGPFERPDADGHLVVETIASAGAALDRIEADLHCKDGKASLEARLFHLQAGGLPAGLLGTAPIEIKAETSLDSKTHPIAFSLAHPLLQMTGTAIPTENPDISADIVVPDLAPFSKLAGMSLKGRAVVSAMVSG